MKPIQFDEAHFDKSVKQYGLQATLWRFIWLGFLSGMLTGTGLTWLVVR
jgi:hypothetical protein